MTNQRSGVQLKDGKSASDILFNVLHDVQARHAEVFSSIDFPKTVKRFRDDYINVLPRFEAARIVSPSRVGIARELSEALAKQLVFQSENKSEVQSIALSDYVSQSFNPLPLKNVAAKEGSGWYPRMTDGDDEIDDLEALGERLCSRNVLTRSASRALAWLQSNALAEGRLDLSSRKIVVLGANAEMAPTELYLAAGADVLWLDIAPPSDTLRHAESRVGKLSWSPVGADILNQPGEVLSTITQFADGCPVDICLYAYAPGQARELRLTGAMNAIVNALPAELIASVTLLVSPTTATPLSPADIDDLEQRLLNRPRWEAVLDRLGMLGSGGGYASVEDSGASRTLVAIQGASYQAAQYLGKIVMAETWAGVGQTGLSTPTPLRVSANTAAITQTRSLNHPVFDAAFGGAAALQVETFTPVQSQCLNGLLAVHDWLHPEWPIPSSIRVHGGIHTLPYPLNTALRIAAAIGFFRSPKLLGALLRPG